MQTLHILRSEPDEWVEKFINAISGEEGAMVVPLYSNYLYQGGAEKNPEDWQMLVENIFKSSRVICWW